MLFLGMYMVCFILLGMEQTRYDRVLEEKKKTEQALLEAMETVAEEYTAFISAPVEKRQQVFEQSFLNNIYISLGILEDVEEQEGLRLYLPLLVIVEDDGAYFCHVQERQNGEVKELTHEWSEKYNFSFPEDSSEAQKKAIMIECLEKTASVYISYHNDIASQFGISYSFSVPSFLQNTESALELPILLAVFQGWPLNAAGDVFYENCLDAGGYLRRKERYRVELPKNLEMTKSIYHKVSCAEIAGKQDSVGKEYLTEQEAVRIYGAYPCEFCNP